MNKYMMLSALVIATGVIKAEMQTPMPAPAPLCANDIRKMGPCMEGVQTCIDVRWKDCCCPKARNEIVEAVAECVENCQKPDATLAEQDKAIDKMTRCCRKIAARNNDEVTVLTSIIIIAPNADQAVQDEAQEAAPEAEQQEAPAPVEAGQ